MATPQPFPTDWRSALVLVPHPDDPEYGMAAAVAKWTTAGKTVRYALACRGEAGIAGMEPERAGPIRDAEQRRAAAIVGVDDVDFWDFPDSNIRNTAELRAKIASVIGETKPDVVLTIYGGPEFAPGMPNQRDHIEFAAAVTAAYDALPDPPRWLFQGGPQPTHVETVDGYIDVAVAALAAHQVYLSVLDPHTPVQEQARRVLDMTTPSVSGGRVAGFLLERSTDQ
ncbi:PIG-L deacetylase family protein [Mycobacterium talmoniae]|uniref:PIG-L family deacetylase n=1 Tax=Mycobacterium talmoniae TaxID=1858794 RepID=A0A1S1NLW9_9MYCO|nr:MULTISPECIES: PIG-L family deacetylase [Mycobacterium]OHV04931.1 PIG-L family deacetylase [Mycobacterium talmoniae]PQM46860.1 putative N-acetyl-alpha-D-glucosaminyl L-malate deacetylase 2 [Mycobacterium talmoniae]TDH54207.1 PIG-L family deacetylase [Mycobacterium eburneum]